ncbi:hypothetical protein CL654_02265 [bacterium]|nr:hypothetical protein [bacterium]|tara:strand:+ start:5566 stop:6096 length:531 start_codon:yes stop_codon:yes gene_type:complete
MSFTVPEGEKLEMFFRRHWFVYFISSFPSIVAVIILIPLAFIAGEALSQYVPDARRLVVIVVASILLIEWSILFVKWVNYALDLWVITTTRVYDIEQYALFSRDVSEFRLDRIQDITVEVKGIIPTLLNFGDVHVQTAGKSRDFVFKQVPDPYGARNKIAEHVDRALKKSTNKAGF